MFSTRQNNFLYNCCQNFDKQFRRRVEECCPFRVGALFLVYPLKVWDCDAFFPFGRNGSSVNKFFETAPSTWPSDMVLHTSAVPRDYCLFMQFFDFWETLVQSWRFFGLFIFCPKYLFVCVCTYPFSCSFFHLSYFTIF